MCITCVIFHKRFSELIFFLAILTYNSRTDSGVHALNSAVVVDLQRQNDKPYDASHIVHTLNEHFDESEHEIRVNGVQLVPNTFNEHINAVKSRTYLYRLGIIQKDTNIDYRLEEKYRCYFIYS